MQTLIPLTSREPWTVTGGAGSDDDVTIAIDREPDLARCSIRTMVRPGTRIGPHGHINGQVTDAMTIASLAAGCLLLEVLPAELPAHEAVASMKEVDARALSLAEDRAEWTVTALPLDGIDYAFFPRSIPEGTIAHADLGWATIAMWSPGPLYDGALQLADIDPSIHLPGR